MYPFNKRSLSIVFFIIVSLLLILNSNKAFANESCVTQTDPPFESEFSSKRLKVTVYSNYDLECLSDDIKNVALSLYITNRGVDLDYDEVVSESIENSEFLTDETLVLYAQYEVRSEYLCKKILKRKRSRLKRLLTSRGFSLLDELVNDAADSEILPYLEEVAITGHGCGEKFVELYETGNNIEDIFEDYDVALTFGPLVLEEPEPEPEPDPDPEPVPEPEPDPEPVPEPEPDPEPVPEPEPEPIFDPSEYEVWVVDTSSPVGKANIASYLKTEGYDVVYYVNESELLGEITADLIVMPGGTTPLDMGRDAAIRTAIQAFVSGGGHYIGVCGGAIAGAKALYVNYFGMEFAVPGYNMLGLLDVKGLDNYDWMEEYMNSSGSLYPFNTPILMGDHPIVTPHQNEELVMAYRAGPILKLLSSNDPNIEVVATFTEDLDSSVTKPNISGQPAIVAGTHGKGRVVLFSTHPEYSYPDYQNQDPPLDDVKYLLLNAAEWTISGE